MLEEASEEDVLYIILSKQAEAYEDVMLMSSASQKIYQICGSEPNLS